MLPHCCVCHVAAHASQIMLKHTQSYDWNKTRAKYTESESLQDQSVLYHNCTSWMQYLVAHYILSNIHENPIILLANWMDFTDLDELKLANSGGKIKPQHNASQS